MAKVCFVPGSGTLAAYLSGEIDHHAAQSIRREIDAQVDDRLPELLKHYHQRDVAKAVTEIKAGKVEYRLDKTNIIHCPIGKVSFGPEKLNDNFNALIGAIVKAKPAAAKGQYIRSCVTASTMGPGIKLSTAKLV